MKAGKLSAMLGSAIVLGATVVGCGAVTSGPSGSGGSNTAATGTTNSSSSNTSSGLNTSQAIKVAMIPKLIGVPYFHRCRRWCQVSREQVEHWTDLQRPDNSERITTSIHDQWICGTRIQCDCCLRQ